MTGQEFQHMVCKMLSVRGFWAYETINKQSGQPVDVIAAKDNVCYIIECKVTQTDRFPLNRVEDNQITAIERFENRGNTQSWFSFFFEKHPDDVLFVRAKYILEFIDSGIASVSYWELFDIRGGLV